jgi:hypothetical protein
MMVPAFMVPEQSSLALCRGPQRSMRKVHAKDKASSDEASVVFLLF